MNQKRLRQEAQVQSLAQPHSRARLRLFSLLTGTLIMLVSLATANAWHVQGTVVCANGTPYPGVTVTVSGTSSCAGAINSSTTTDSSGSFLVTLPDCDACYTATIDTTTLPSGATISSIVQASGTTVT